MEILTVIGVIVLIVVIFVVGGLLGWGLKGIGEIFSFLSEGWNSCWSVIAWIILIVIFLMALAS